MAWSRQPAAPGCHSGCGPRCIVWRPTASAGHPPAASISHDTWQVAGCRLHGAEEWQLVQHWWRHKSGSQAMGAAGALNQWISTLAWIGLQPHNTRDGTRAHNLLLRGEAPYPLGHTSSCNHGLAATGCYYPRRAAQRTAGPGQHPQGMAGSHTIWGPRGQMTGRAYSHTAHTRVLLTPTQT